MDENTITIIGNGFDVCHDIPSKYSDFKRWLQIHNESLYGTLNQYIDISGDWWNDFEKNLAEFHILKLTNEVPRDYSQRDPRFPPTPLYPASVFFRTIREQISACFTEWTKTLSCSNIVPSVELPSAFLYISFNYTDTLEKVYNIPETKILYIHGKASRGDELVFGHNKSHFELEEYTKWKYNLFESEKFLEPGTFGDEEFQLTLEVSFFDKFPYTQLVKYEKTLQSAVVRAKTIWLYGFSFSSVDYQYVEWIAERNPCLKWIASWHSERDKLRILDTFKALGVTRYELFYA